MTSTHYPGGVLNVIAEQLAEPDAVLLSKARMAPEKNEALLVEYLARGPSERFLALAAKYGVDLGAFVE